MIAVPDYLKPLERLTLPFPREAVDEAAARWEETAPIFREVLDWASHNPEAVPAGYLLHEYALRLLAQFRDTGAYAATVRSLRRPQSDNIWGNTITEDMRSLLASVSGGNILPLQALIEDDQAYEFARASGLGAMAVLCREGSLSREELSGYLGELLTGKLARSESYIWTALADVCGAFGFAEHESAVKAAWDDGLVDSFFDHWQNQQRRMRSGKFDPSETDRYSYFGKAAESMEWWHCFRPKSQASDNKRIDLSGWKYESDDLAERPAPYRADPKVGRNEPCPCGSGKKFKKCCG